MTLQPRAHLEGGTMIDVDTLHLKENDYQIEIDGASHFHIKEVQVVNGDDDGWENERFRCKVDGNLKLIAEKSTYRKRAFGRYRFEPAAKVIVTPEELDLILVLSIYHHKGSLNLKVETYEL